MKKYRYIFLTFLLFQGLLAFSQEIPPRPDPPRLVNDLAGVLTAEQVQQLERKLVNFNDTTSTQITVVTVKSLNGYDKADFAYKIGEQWGVGQKGKNNGIVVLVKPKYGNERGEAFIASGYGLEGAIPDAIGKRIIEYEMIPNFAENNYYGGLDAATTTLMGLAAGEFTADQYVKRGEKSPYAFLIPLLIMGVVFFLIRSSRARSHSVGKNIPFWTAFWLLGSMGGHSGSWNNFHSGSGGFGGGGGGGFGGFGGGSFGGGGAGGSW
ncbi:MAG: TPM domain-containing protein [Bacteroidales bacterium]|nr:TPM domain-containing protein [Bacteroidales bacterium]